MKHITIIVFAVLMTVVPGAHAATIWDESVNGPLSPNPASPTIVTLVSSSDQILGLPPLGLHVFQFTVPLGNTVSSMIVDPGPGIMEVELISASINCPPRPVIATPTELLDGASCAPSLPPGDYTFVVDVLASSVWDVTIASDVPVELQSLTVD